MFPTGQVQYLLAHKVGFLILGVSLVNHYVSAGCVNGS